MKTILQLVIVSSLLISCGHKVANTNPVAQEETESEYKVRLDGENFPDLNFRSVVCRLLPVAESDLIPDELLLNVKELRVSELGIHDLRGIEFFTALEQLDCSGNQLTKLDVSKNTALKRLECGNNQLSEIDVTHNALLEGLGCCKNQLKSIDVSHNPELEHLLCNENKISSIDVSHNPKLRELGVVKCKLRELNVKNNFDLEKLYCTGNDLKELNLSNNTKMINLYCKQPLFGHIDIICPANNPNLGLDSFSSWSNGLTLMWVDDFNKNQMKGNN